jgi:hypothetical protein
LFKRGREGLWLSFMVLPSKAQAAHVQSSIKASNGCKCSALPHT